jgi:hypothetical protein
LNEVPSDSIVATVDQAMTFDPSDEATEAAETTTYAIEMTAGDENLMGIAIVEDGDPPKDLVTEKLDLTEDNNARMGAENGLHGMRLQSLDISFSVSSSVGVDVVVRRADRGAVPC